MNAWLILGIIAYEAVAVILWGALSAIVKQEQENGVFVPASKRAKLCLGIFLLWPVVMLLGIGAEIAKKGAK